jgi:hypothetical protein
MSAVLGYERGVMYNNDIMNRNSRLQQAIADSNKQTLDDYRFRNQQNAKISAGIESTAEKAESAKEEQKGEEGAGEFLADARNVYKMGGAVRKEIANVNNAVKSYRRANFINEGGGIDPTGEGTGAMRGQIAENRDPELRPGGGEEPEEPSAPEEAGAPELEEPRDPILPGGESDADVNAILDFGDSLGNRIVGGAGRGALITGDRAVNGALDGVRGAVGTLGDRAGAVGSALADTSQAVLDTTQAVRNAGSAGEAVSGLVQGVGKTVSSSKNVLGALDSLGKTAEGLNVVSGVSDILDDTDGGFSKMNTAEKVGNIAGITSGIASAGSLAGSLESAGAMLDATGIGAELGIGLNIAGAVAGGVSAIADYIGGKEKQKRQTPAPTQLQAPKPLPQAQAPISALQSGGVALSGYN